MNLMNKLTNKDLILNKKRTTVTIIGIILSVALITALCTLYQSLLGSLINFEISEKGNYHALFYQVEQSDIEKYKKNINVDSIYYSKDIGYSLVTTRNDYKPYIFIKGITSATIEKFPIRILEGKMPTNSNEIIIPSHLKTNGRVTYNVGDTITLNVGKRVIDNMELNQNNPYITEENDGEITSRELIINTKEKQYKIVGIMERLSSEIEPYEAPGYTFLTIINENELNDKLDTYIRFKKKALNNIEEQIYNMFDIDYKEAKTCEKEEEETDNCLKLKEKIKYGIELNEYLIKLETDPLGIKTTDGFIIVILVVCAIIVFTSVFCIKNSFDISITEKIKQYGMLKSIGATKKQIKKNVLYEATILGSIGIPLGILSGFLASYILIIICNYYMKDMITFDICFTFSWISVFVSILLGIVTIYLSAIKSANKASKVSAIESIRNSKEIKLNPKKIKAPKIINKLFGIGGEISYKNLKRNKKKYRTTTISIIVSVIVFISLTSLMNMALTSVKADYTSNEYNISLYLNNIRPDNNTLNSLLEDNTVNNYVISKHSGLEMPKDRINKEYIKLKNYKEEDLDNIIFYVNVETLNKEKYMDYIKKLNLNYDDVKNKGILFDISKIYVSTTDSKGKESIETKYTRIFDYKKNDKITGLQFGDKNKPKELTIGLVTDKQPWGFTNNQAATLYVSEEFFNSNFEIDNIRILFDSSNATKLQDNIEKVLGNDDYEIYNKEEEERMMRNFFTLLGIFFYGFIIVITLIGVTNIFNTITTNIELRKQEFATLRSIGMTKKEFNSMIRLETVFMGTKALFYGISIGLLLSYILHLFLNKTTGLSYIFPLNAVIISIITVFLLITLIMNYSVSKIKKQNIIETIRNENI